MKNRFHANMAFFLMAFCALVVSITAAPPNINRARADFDGDGKSDIAVFRGSDATWYLKRSSAGLFQEKFGLNGDIPVPGDYDADGKTDIATFRPESDPKNADYYVLNSSTGTVSYLFWGLPGDVPFAADYDGDEKSDIALWRPSEAVWYILKSTGGFMVTSFGRSSDTPIVGDFDGDFRADMAVYRAGSGDNLSSWIIRPSSGGADKTLLFGVSGDMPVPADYDGNGKDDLAVFRPSTGTWNILGHDGQTAVTKYGLEGDVPVTGDYDGDGKSDCAVFRDGTWYVNRSTSGAVQMPFGVADDIPLAKQYVP